MNAKKTDVMIIAAAVTTLDEALNPWWIGLAGVAADDELLAHGRDEEHLVVHGQPEEHAHHEDGQELTIGPADSPMTASSQPHWKAATTEPSAAPTESR